MRYYLVAVGAIFIVAALWLGARRLRVMLDGWIALGRIEGFESRAIDDEVSYLPIVVFRDETGVECRFTSVAGGSQRQPPVGTPVRVRYRRGQPDTAYIDTFLHMWAAPLAFAVLGTAAIAAAWF